jgi:hypothetical protein
MKTLAAIVAAAVVWYTLRSRSLAKPMARPRPSFAPARERPPGGLSEADFRYLAGTFEHVNDRVMAQIRAWDGLSAAVLGAIVAVYVLFVDKADVYWPALAALIIPAAFLYGNLEDRIEFSPDPLVFEQAYRANPAAALEGLVDDHKTFIRSNTAARGNKRQAFYRSLYWLFAACLAAALCRGYNAHGEIDAKIHQMATWLEAHTRAASPLHPELHLRSRRRSEAPTQTLTTAVPAPAITRARRASASRRRRTCRRRVSKSELLSKHRGQMC